MSPAAKQTNRSRQAERQIPYPVTPSSPSRFNRLPFLFVSLVAAKLADLVVEHLSDRFSDFVALHVIALFDPILRNAERCEVGRRVLVQPDRFPLLLLQLGHVIHHSNCQQLLYAALGTHCSPTRMALSAWSDGARIDYVILATQTSLTCCGPRRI